MEAEGRKIVKDRGTCDVAVSLNKEWVVAGLKTRCHRVGINDLDSVGVR